MLRRRLVEGELDRSTHALQAQLGRRARHRLRRRPNDSSSIENGTLPHLPAVYREPTEPKGLRSSSRTPCRVRTGRSVLARTRRTPFASPELLPKPRAQARFLPGAFRSLLVSSCLGARGKTNTRRHAWSRGKVPLFIAISKAGTPFFRYSQTRRTSSRSLQAVLR
jgi:hypothetical protein